MGIKFEVGFVDVLWKIANCRTVPLWSNLKLPNPVLLLYITKDFHPQPLDYNLKGKRLPPPRTWVAGDRCTKNSRGRGPLYWTLVLLHFWWNAFVRWDRKLLLDVINFNVFVDSIWNILGTWFCFTFNSLFKFYKTFSKITKSRKSNPKPAVRRR